MFLNEMEGANKSQLGEVDFLCADGLSDYIVFDFETTGYQTTANQIIEIAMLKFKNGAYCSRYETLVKPQGSIHPQAYTVHGITLANLADAPRIEDLAEELAAFIGDSLLIGHNILSYDLKFLQDLYQNYLNRASQFPCIDTLPLSRTAFPRLPKHSLSYLADALCIRAGKSHRAMSDVIVTNRLLQCCAEQGCTLRTFRREGGCPTRFTPVHRHKRQATTSHYHAYTKAGYVHVDPNTILCSVSDFDQSHPFYAKNIVLTGIFQRSREDLIRLAKNCGAKVDKNVTLSTHVLLVGKQDTQVVGEDGRSGREEKAHTYNQAGKTNIVFLSEEEFLGIVKDGAYPAEPVASR